MTIGPTVNRARSSTGNSSSNRVFAPDLRPPGTYDAAPCELARVTIFRFTRNASGAADARFFEVAAATCSRASTKTLRAACESHCTVEAGAQLPSPIPAPARWVDIEGGHVQSSLGTVVAAKCSLSLRSATSVAVANWVGAGRCIVRDEADRASIPIRRRLQPACAVRPAPSRARAFASGTMPASQAASPSNFL